MSEPKHKIEQFIQLKDDSGMLKNLSELLQEVRDKNIKNLYIGYTRKNESMRTFWFGDQKSMAEFFLTVAQMEHDYLSNRFEEYSLETYGEEE